MPAPALRNGIAAVNAAVTRGNVRCYVMLAGGAGFDFIIEQVTEDGLIGRRSVMSDTTAAVVFFDAIALIEFKP
jgi:hypothetical protein